MICLMNRRNLLGKLIISKSNDQYKTFHDLNLILVRGNGNKIIINHVVTKLLIKGNNNLIDIGQYGVTDEIILKGNNNIITAKYDYSLNVDDSGNGNTIYVRKKEKIVEKNIQEDKICNKENSEESKLGEEKNKNTINRVVHFKISENNLGNYNDDDYFNEREDDEDDDGGYDMFGFISDVPFFDIQEEIERQLQREREKEIFRASIASMFFGKQKDESLVEPEIILCDLIDIPFKNVSKGVKEGNEKCVICFEDFEENESVKMTKCFHIFHYKCIKKWIESKQELIEEPDCPICRREL